MDMDYGYGYWMLFMRLVFVTTIVLEVVQASDLTLCFEPVRVVIHPNTMCFPHLRVTLIVKHMFWEQHCSRNIITFGWTII